MKRRSAGLLGVMGLALIAGFKYSAAAQIQYCDLPAGPVSFVAEYGDSSYAPINFSDVPPDFTVTNGTYAGWCAQYEVVIHKEIQYDGTLYESLAFLPDHLQNEPWDRINYILNHKQGMSDDIQNAIWFVLGQGHESDITPATQQMIDDASLFGGGFVPTNGQVQVVILDPQQPVQRIIIEVICDDTKPPTASITSPASPTTYTTPQTVTITASASDNVAIGKVEFYDGATLKSTQDAPPYTFPWLVTTDEDGTHDWTVRAYDAVGHSATSSVVTLRVDIDTTAPEVEIISPLPATAFTTAQSISIAAMASDNVGITRVEFYDGPTLMGARTNPPYVFDWSFTVDDNGTHDWMAKAFDATGHSTISPVVPLNVMIDVVPPSVSITTPFPQTYTTSRTVTIVAAVTDNFGVARVEFYDGITLKAILTAAPYIYDWSFTATDNGLHQYSVKAYDAAGNNSVSSPVNLTVDIDVVAPQVSIVSPASARLYTTAQTVTIAASASDNAGVTKVEFYDGPMLKATKTAPPYTHDWSFTAADNGPHQYSAKAYDAAGNNSVSSPVNLTVDIDIVAPQISIASPASATTYRTAQTITLAATASDNVGVTKVEFYDGTMLKATKMAPPYHHDWSFTADDNGLHQCCAKAYDAAGNSTPSSPVDLTVDIDTTAPQVLITGPLPGSFLTNQMVLIQGTASDDAGVVRVEYQLNDGTFETAEGITNWSQRLDLPPGGYVIRVRSVDTSGNVSELASVSFSCFLTCPLRLTMSGEGSITPNLDGMHLDLDKSYTLTAAPGLGYVFSNWTGGLTASTPQLTFVMKSNLVLHATFLSSPFKPIKGTYSGLFYETNGVLHESSGAFTITTTARGTFTGRLQLAGKRHALSGRFNAESKSTNSIARKGTTPLVVALHLVSVNGLDRIMGKITNGDWKAELLGDRAVFQARTNPAPYAGKYTLVVPGSADAASPAGDGAGAATVNAGGQVRLTGRLADGTAISQSAPLSGSGQWPLYLSLYGGKGSLLSWVTFTNRTENDLNGLTSWIKPSLPRAKYYPIGFTNEALLVGSIYTRPVGATNRVLNFTNGIVWLSGGNLALPSTNSVTLNAPNKVINLSSNKLTLAIVSSSGLFTGSFKDPNTGKTLPLRGALLQKQNSGSGYFLGTNQSGHVRFEEAP